MKLVVIIPCLNEAKTIGPVISQIPSHIPGITQTLVLVIDDGSKDETASIARQNGAHVISHIRTRGVGAAFHSGIDAAIRSGADIVVNLDGDGQFNPGDIPTLIRPIIDRQADCVTASRFKSSDLIPDMPQVKKWGNSMMAKLISFLVKRKYHDVSCGFRAYSLETILRMNLFGQFTYTQETFLDLAFKNLIILEVPITVRGERKHGRSRVAHSLWNYAIQSSKIIFRTFRDYKPLKFFICLSLCLFFIAACLGGFFLMYYLNTGKFTGHLWAGFSAGFLLLFSFLLFLTGLLSDIFTRLREGQEKILYIEKRKIWEKAKRTKNENI
jgi:glycosyltransferase involved in cell wall biosynthesis